MLEFLIWQNSLGATRELALWVAVSILLYVVGAQLAWRLHDLDAGFLGSNIRWLDSWRFRGHAWQLLRFLYYVVIPYGLIVQRRLLSGRWMGLVGSGEGYLLGWSGQALLRGIGLSVIVVATGAALLAWAWRALARRLPAGSGFALGRQQPAWELFWDALFLQMHWGFYRAAAGIWLHESSPYWSVLLGLGLVALEAAGDPSLYFDRPWPSLASSWARLGLVMWSSSMLFLATQNFWLPVAAHWALTVVSNALSGRISIWSLRMPGKQERLLEDQV